CDERSRPIARHYTWWASEYCGNAYNYQTKALRRLTPYRYRSRRRFSLKRWKIVHFHKGDANSVVHAAHNRGIVSGWQRSDDRRLGWLSRSMPAVLDRGDLVAGYDSADYRGLPVIVRGN